MSTLLLSLLIFEISNGMKITDLPFDIIGESMSYLNVFEGMKTARLISKSFNDCWKNKHQDALDDVAIFDDIIANFATYAVAPSYYDTMEELKQIHTKHMHNLNPLYLIHLEKFVQIISEYRKMNDVLDSSLYCSCILRSFVTGNIESFNTLFKRNVESTSLDALNAEEFRAFTAIYSIMTNIKRHSKLISAQMHRIKCKFKFIMDYHAKLHEGCYESCNLNASEAFSFDLNSIQATKMNARHLIYWLKNSTSNSCDKMNETMPIIITEVTQRLKLFRINDMLKMIKVELEKKRCFPENTICPYIFPNY